MIFHKNYTLRSMGFTMVEVIIAIALIGIGITSTVAALTNLNAFASASRNATGAYAAAMNEIDAIQSATPFNPQAGAIPPVLAIGTHPDVTVPIYDPGSGSVVSGTRRTVVADASSGGVTIYRATVSVTYTYRNRPYSFSMSTLRAPDQ